VSDDTVSQTRDLWSHINKKFLITIQSAKHYTSKLFSNMINTPTNMAKKLYANTPWERKRMAKEQFARKKRFLFCCFLFLVILIGLLLPILVVMFPDPAFWFSIIKISLQICWFSYVHLKSLVVFSVMLDLLGAMVVIAAVFTFTFYIVMLKSGSTRRIYFCLWLLVAAYIVFDFSSYFADWIKNFSSGNSPHVDPLVQANYIKIFNALKIVVIWLRNQLMFFYSFKTKVGEWWLKIVIPFKDCVLRVVEEMDPHSAVTAHQEVPDYDL